MPEMYISPQIERPARPRRQEMVPFDVARAQLFHPSRPSPQPSDSATARLDRGDGQFAGRSEPRELHPPRIAARLRADLHHTARRPTHLQHGRRIGQRVRQRRLDIYIQSRADRLRTERRVRHIRRREDHRVTPARLDQLIEMPPRRRLTSGLFPNPRTGRLAPQPPQIAHADELPAGPARDA